LIAEELTETVRELLIADDDMIVWWGTIVECWAAIARRERESELSADAADRARMNLRMFKGAWSEIEASDDVRDYAMTSAQRHRLRSADALQLGAALAWAHGRPRDHIVCTLDDRIVEAARREGFNVVPTSR
jgi:predicted nucleic acid-binding protein